MFAYLWICWWSANYYNCCCAITALFGSLVASFQNDLKKIIAYSTCSQLGYMSALVVCPIMV